MPLWIKSASEMIEHAESREPGGLKRMLDLVAMLGLTYDDLKHHPHHIAAGMAEGCLWDEEFYAYYGRCELKPGEGWHAAFRAQADQALAAGLNGILAYLLANLWESGVEGILRNPGENADLSPEQVAERYRLMLRADATFPCPAYWYREQAARAWEGRSDG